MNIYVGNLPFTASEDEVRQAFAAYGTVSSDAIIKDRDLKPDEQKKDEKPAEAKPEAN